MPRRNTYKRSYSRSRRRDYEPRRRRSVWMRPEVQVAILAVAALIIFLILQGGGGAKNNAAPPREVSVDEAYSMYQNGAYLLDVRTVEEWDDFHAPNTTLIPLEELAARVDEVPRDRQIVVICRSGNRSQDGRDILLEAGFTQVVSMTGGLNEWRASGYPVE